MSYARICAVLLLSCLVIEVVCQPQFIVNNGDGTCSSVGLDECVPCTTASGNASFVEARNFKYGRVQSSEYSSSSCVHESSDIFWRYPSICENLDPCTIAATTFNSFHVASSEQITLIDVPAYDYWGITYMNQTHAVTAGKLEYQLFQDESGSIIRLVSLFDDGSYATNLGLCNLDVWCQAGSWSYMLTTLSLPDMSASSHAEKMVADGILGRVMEPLVELNLKFDMSATSGTLFVHFDDIVTVPASDLGSVIATDETERRLSDMELKNTDLDHPKILATLNVNDFESYIVGNCYHGSEADQPFDNSDVVTCDISFVGSFSRFIFKHVHSSFFDDDSDFEPANDLAWEEKPAFSLFE